MSMSHSGYKRLVFAASGVCSNVAYVENGGSAHNIYVSPSSSSSRHQTGRYYYVGYEIQ